MIRDAPRGLQDMFAIQKTPYTAAQALEAKDLSCWPVYKLSTILQSAVPPTALSLHVFHLDRILNLYTDDALDFSDDHISGNINIMQGFIYERIKKGYSYMQAAQWAEQRMNAHIEWVSAQIDLMEPAAHTIERFQTPYLGLFDRPIAN